MTRTVQSRILLKKLPLCVLSSFIIGFGVSFLILAQLGSDPMSLLLDGFARTTGLPLGTASGVFNFLFLFAAFLAARRYLHIGTITHWLGLSVSLGLFEPFARAVLGPAPTLTVRVLAMLGGEIIICIGLALNISMRLGFNSADALVFAVRDKTSWPFRNIRIGSDALYAVAGLLLGGVCGVGTVLSVLCTGPLIELFSKLLNRTLLRWMRMETVDINE